MWNFLHRLCRLSHSVVFSGLRLHAYQLAGGFVVLVKLCIYVCLPVHFFLGAVLEHKEPMGTGAQLGQYSSF